jgi:hypothetical protein
MDKIVAALRFERQQSALLGVDYSFVQYFYDLLKYQIILTAVSQNICQWR